MTEWVLLLAAAAIVGAAVVRWSMTRRRGPEPIDRSTGREPRDPWLLEAGEVAHDGLLLVQELEPIVAGDPAAAANGSKVADPIGRLDDLTRRLAELSTTAPTEMDGRVCRNAAVRSRVFGDAWRRRSSDLSAIPDRVGPGRSELVDRQSECELALHDLTEHVDLL